MRPPYTNSPHRNNESDRTHKQLTNYRLHSILSSPQKNHDCHTGRGICSHTLKPISANHLTKPSITHPGSRNGVIRHIRQDTTTRNKGRVRIMSTGIIIRKTVTDTAMTHFVKPGIGVNSTTTTLMRDEAMLGPPS